MTDAIDRALQALDVFVGQYLGPAALELVYEHRADEPLREAIRAIAVEKPDMQTRGATMSRREEWLQQQGSTSDPDVITNYTVADALNNAIAAIYANVGPSCPLVDIRRAMRLLGIAEDERARTWVNNGSGWNPTATPAS